MYHVLVFPEILTVAHHFCQFEDMHKNLHISWWLWVADLCKQFVNASQHKCTQIFGSLAVSQISTKLRVRDSKYVHKFPGWYQESNRRCFRKSWFIFECLLVIFVRAPCSMTDKLYFPFFRYLLRYPTLLLIRSLHRSCEASISGRGRWLEAGWRWFNEGIWMKELDWRRRGHRQHVFLVLLFGGNSFSQWLNLTCSVPKFDNYSSQGLCPRALLSTIREQHVVQVRFNF